MSWAAADVVTAAYLNERARAFNPGWEMECPRSIPFIVWRQAVEELNRECPVPYGLYEGPIVATRPDPVETVWR